MQEQKGQGKGSSEASVAKPIMHDGAIVTSCNEMGEMEHPK
jgi:hypothetical protein